MLEPDPTRPLYIVWDTVEWVCTSWGLAPGEERWIEKETRTRVRWANEATAEMIALARQYLAAIRPEAWLELGERNQTC